MTLTYDQLVALLAAGSGGVSVGADSFDPGPVATLVETCFTPPVFAVTQAQVDTDPANSQVTVSGVLPSGAFLGIGGATVTTATFTVGPGGGLSSTMTVRIDDPGWTPSMSFPALTGSVFDQFSYAGSVLAFDSAGAAGPGPDVRAAFGYPPDLPAVTAQLVSGLSLSAVVSPAGRVPGALVALVGAAVPVAGPIAVFPNSTAAAAGPLPQLVLAPTGEPGRTLVLGSATLAIAPELVSLLSETAPVSAAAVEAADEADSGGDPAGGSTVTANGILALRGSLSIAGGAVDLDLNAFVTRADATTLEFDSGALPVTPIGTSEVSGVAGADLGSLLEPGHGFPAYGGFSLQRLTITFQLAATPVTEVSALLAVTSQQGGPDPVWSLFGGAVEVHGIVFALGLSHAGATTTPTVTVVGSASLGSATALAASISLPALAFTGSLASTGPTDLNAVLSGLGLDLQLPDLTAATLAVAGDVAAATYSLDADATGGWTLIGSAPTGLILDEITLHVAVAPDSPATAALGAALSLRGTQLATSGTYTHGAGWVLTAGTAAGQSLDLATVAGAVLQPLGITLPGSLPSVVLASCTVTYSSDGRLLTVDAVFADDGTSLFAELGQAVTGIAGLPAIGLSELSSGFGSGPDGTTISLQATGSGTWTIPLGATALEISGVTASMIRAATAPPAADPVLPGGPAEPPAGTGDLPAPAAAAADGPAPLHTTGHLTGIGSIAGITGTVDWTLPGAFSLQGNLPAVRLVDLVSLLSGGSLTVPPALDVGLPASTITITEYGGDFALSWVTAATSLGELALDVRRLAKGGAWGIAAGFALPAGWQLSRLSGSLSALNVLTFDDAVLVLSSFADPAFAFAELPLPDAATGVIEGLTFGCRLQLTGALGGVSAILGTSTLAVTAQIGPDPGTTRLTAALSGPVLIPLASNLVLGGAAVTITALPLGISLAGSLTIPIGEQSLTATGRFSITQSAADFALDITGTALSLASPMGFRGVELDEIGVVLGIAFEPPGLNLGLAGAFHFGGGTAAADRFAFAFTVEGEAVTPTLLSCHLDELDLPTIFGACMLPTAVLPSALNQISITDLTIYWCDTLQPLPDGTTAQPGYGFSGTLTAFGWQAMALLTIDFTSGVHGAASIDPVHLGNGAIGITGTAANGGPFLMVDTTSSPYLHVTLDVALFDIVGTDVQGTLSSSGMTFTVANTLGTLDARLVITADPTHASFASSVAVDLDVWVGPLDLPGTALTLGRIHVQAGLAGSTTMNLDSSGFTATIDGGFIWQGQHFQLATVTLTVTPTEVAGIASAVAAAVEDQAEALFGDYLSASRNYFALVETGLVDGASDAATIATGYYHLTADQTAALFTSLDLRADSSVHTDVGTGHLDTAPHTDVPTAHVDTAPSHIDTPGAHTDIASQHGDVPGQHVDSSTHNDIGGQHTDFTFGRHADTALPHGDGTPHTDQETIPHVDVNGPHTDFAPHVDQTSTPHVDAGTLHVDAAPHGDVSPHVDDTTHVDT